MTDFGETIFPVAAKNHRCEWCGDIIAKGVNHAKFAGRWDGEWQNWRMHRECYSYADNNDALVDGFTPYEGERPQGQS